MADEVGDAERRVGLDEIETVVDDTPAFRGGRLGRPDVEAPVDLARIGRDDLRIAAGRPQGERELDGEARLAGGGRAADYDERRPAVRADPCRDAQATTPRREYGPIPVTRTRVSRPRSAAGPATWTSLFSRLRPDRRTSSGSTTGLVLTTGASA
jgi:hypothetical protein